MLVGLSGGVDSSVAAALLKKQGYEVAGVFMRFWKDGRGGENACCSVESEASALAIAQKLGIPFYVFDFSKEFKKEVVDYFLSELKAGRTPNPCVMCNPEIKFGLFLDKAKKLGADFVATGHYARIQNVKVRSIPPLLGQGGVGGGNFKFGNYPTSILPLIKGRRGIVKLFAAKDKQKDQSYFLYRLTQEQLSQALFPLAGYTKAEVYKLAKHWRLPHQAHQSFDICFIEDYGKFLGKYLKMRPGRIVKIANDANWCTNTANKNLPQPLLKEGGSLPLGRVREDLVKVLGMHQGLPFYTIGQRASIGGPGPFFAVKKDVKKNILYVSNNERDLYQKEMLVEKVNWLGGQALKLPLKCKVKIRYGSEPAEALIAKRGSRIVIKFQKPQRAITPGQSAVFYGRGGEVLGGGIIK